MEENIIFNLKNFKAKIIPTLTVCGSALLLLHGKASADQVNNNQDQSNAQSTATVNADDSATNTNNNNDQTADTNTLNVNSANTQNIQNSTVSALTTALYTTNAVNNNINSASSKVATTQTKYNKNDNGNYAWLDSAKLNDSAQVEVSGWHATNQSVDKPYHFIIGYDVTTNSEFARVLVNNPVTRTDVQQAHNVYGASQSGFNVKLQIPSNLLKNGDTIKIVSRYSNASNGQGQNVDYWFNPITLDKDNHGWLDNFSVNGNQLTVSGWNATNQSVDKQYHTVMIYDRTAGKVVASQSIQDQTRNDVAKAYPNVVDADQSGFSASFNISANGINLTHELQVISRYSTQANGNGQVVDFAYSPVTYYNGSDKGNYGWLDSVKLNNNQQVQVSGWNATNGAYGKQYHYVIMFDKTTNKEISRVLVNDPVSRNDVRNAHNVYGAEKSGFNVTFNVPDYVLGNSHTISFVSRYSDAASGEGNRTDYWFAPMTFDESNNAWLDNVSVNNNTLQVSGWNATNQSADKPYHTVIIYDRTLNHEVARLATPITQRDDVQKAYPNVINGSKSGFEATFGLNNINLNHELQVISRYSTQKNGDGTYVDYWFSPFTKGNNQNYGYLDNYNYSDGKQLTFAGWHANDVSTLEKNHFVILYDNTANRQVAVVKPVQATRNDVARAYPSVSTASQSGFYGSFDLTNTPLTSGHSYSIVSRYSTDNSGNGDRGQYTDYWYNAISMTKKSYWFDYINMDNDGLHLSGWMASDYSVNRNNAFIIVLNDGREVARTKVDLSSRSDVANARNDYYNSKNSGFNTVVKLNPLSITGNMQIVMRFSSSVNGDYNYDDQFTQPTPSNVGWFDSINVSDRMIYVSGWHASNQTINKRYQYLIFVDANSGKELYRERVWDDFISRTDVQKSYPGIYDSLHSGFQLAFGIPSYLDHHTVKVIHRITDDVNGNGNYVDIYSGNVSIHNSNRWGWPFPQDGEGTFTGAQLFGVNPGGQFRVNGYHDGVDFGSYSHPGTQVHAVHSGTIVGVGYMAGLDWYVLQDTGDYLVVYQEAFSNRGQINVSVGQQVQVGDVIGNRDTSHLHLGITRQKNFNVALGSAFTNNGVWLNPLDIIRNGLNG
ncbi:MAG: M23 family metallopeptidase [Limosilactobacillus sp.]|uniref:M23 family metallopeptidase n=1 Tax=Limosilactobacillus sp. TaxID=2773925 RepID=UPI002710D79F|nr:M23 family metallopeptidase [Limosilactobacillus sp.]